MAAMAQELQNGHGTRTTSRQGNAGLKFPDGEEALVIFGRATPAQGCADGRLGQTVAATWPAHRGHAIQAVRADAAQCAPGSPKSAYGLA